MPHEPRTVTLRFRTTPNGESRMKACAHAADRSLSDWLRWLAWQEIERQAAIERAQRVLPREKWCSLCNQRPLDCPTFRPDCERCNRLQEELRR